MNEFQNQLQMLNVDPQFQASQPVSWDPNQFQYQQPAMEDSRLIPFGCFGCLGCFGCFIGGIGGCGGCGRRGGCGRCGRCGR